MHTFMHMHWVYVEVASIGNPEVGDVQEEGDVEEDVPGSPIPLEEDHAGLPQQEGAASRPVRFFL